MLNANFFLDDYYYKITSQAKSEFIKNSSKPSKHSRLIFHLILKSILNRCRRNKRMKINPNFDGFDGFEGFKLNYDLAQKLSNIQLYDQNN